MKLIYKLVTVLLLFSLSNNVIAGKFYWKQDVATAKWDSMYQGVAKYWFLDSIGMTSTQSLPGYSDTVYFHSTSFYSTQGDTVLITGYQNIDMINWSGFDAQYTGVKPVFIITSNSELTIEKTPSFSENIRYGIEGLFKLNYNDPNFQNFTIDWSNYEFFSDLKKGAIQIGGYSSNAYILGHDLILDSINLKLGAGSFTTNGYKIKCQGFEAPAMSVSTSFTLNVTSNSVIEATGHVRLLPYMGFAALGSYNFDSQTTIILNSHGFDPFTGFSNDPFKFECLTCDFHVTNLEMIDSSKYSFISNSASPGVLTVDNFSLGRNAQVSLGQDDTLAFNTISTTSQSTDYTTIYGGNNTPPSYSYLKDLDGGNSCMYNVKFGLMDATNAPTTFAYTSNDVPISGYSNIGFTFNDPEGGAALYSANNNPMDYSLVKLYKIVSSSSSSQLELVEAVYTDGAGKYKLNPNNFKGDSCVLLAVPSPSLANLIPTYYAKTPAPALQDSSVFTWENAWPYTKTCGSVINDTIRVLEQLPQTGSGFIQGTITEGEGFVFKLSSILGLNDPVQGVKVGLGKNPPGAIVASTTTDANGDYTFGNLPAGDYTVYADIPGLDLVGTHDVTIVGTETVTAQDFVADSAKINPTGVFTNISTKTTVSNNLVVFPNPFNSAIYLQFGEITASTELNLELVDVLGKTILNIKESLHASKNGVKQLDLNSYNLTSGVYILKAKYNNQLVVTRLIKK